MSNSHQRLFKSKPICLFLISRSFTGITIRETGDPGKGPRFGMTVQPWADVGGVRTVVYFRS